jgi:GntR family transcriptional regulator
MTELNKGTESKQKEVGKRSHSSRDTKIHTLSRDAAELSYASPTPLPSFSPLYQQIKALLLSSLQQGEWQPGQVIPSEMDLAERFQVSQGTVRKAIDELASENLLSRRQGVGTFVATHSEERVQYRFLKLMPDSEETLIKGSSSRKIISCKQTQASPKVYKALGLNPKDDVLYLRRVLSFSGVPTILEDIWLPGHSFNGLTAERLRDYEGPLYAFFEEAFSVKMVKAQEKIKAIMPDATQAKLLKITNSTPLLSVERTAFTYNNDPIEFRQGLYLTEDCHYRNELN